MSQKKVQRNYIWRASGTDNGTADVKKKNTVISNAQLIIDMCLNKV